MNKKRLTLRLRAKILVRFFGRGEAVARIAMALKIKKDRVEQVIREGI